MTEEKKPETAVAKRSALPVALGASGALMPANLPEAIEVAKLMAASGILPKQFDGNVGAVLVAIQMGAELGLSPMSAMQNIAVISGRPSMWGDAVLGLVLSHPDCLDVNEDFDEKTSTATCTVRRRGRQPVVRTFSQADARTANLWGKQGPWTQYPKRMLQMRARGFACRDSFPDALRGIRTTEEVRDTPIDSLDGGFLGATLEVGDHDFGFRPRPTTPEPEKTAEPAKQPRPLSAKEKAWREKNGKQVQYDPATGEVRDAPADEPHPLTPEEIEKYSKIGEPPMDENPEPGSRG